MRARKRASTGGCARRATGAVATCVIAAGILACCGGTSGRYEFRAVFQNGQGLFPGASVQVLGVPTGTVTAVQNTGSGVVVTMSVPASEPLPAGVDAALVTPQLLGEPDIDLYPGYVRGPRLSPGATIPQSHTSVPVSIDQFLKELQSYLTAINGSAAGALIHNLATDFSGEGQQLNALIQGAAGTLKVLSDKGAELGQAEGSLGSLTAVLDQHLSTIENLIVSYDAVSGVVAAHRSQLDSAITDLSTASAQLASLISTNFQPLQDDIATIATTGRTLDRNVASLDQALSSAVALFSAVHRAYDPSHQWVNLNIQGAGATTSALLEGQVRDRLAGVCRRILAHHASGLSADQIATLRACGDPSSGYFDPLFALLAGGSASPGDPGTSAASLFAQGLTQIPGLTPSQQSAIAARSPQPGPGGPEPQSTTSTTSQPRTLLGPLPPLDDAPSREGSR